MQTIINRFDFYRFERLVSKLVKPSELPATVSFVPSSDGLLFTAFCNGAVLTLNTPLADGDIAAFTMPWSAVKEFGTKKNHYVDLELKGKDVALSWTENSIPRTKIVQLSAQADKRLPLKPDKTVAHSSRLFDAMVDATKCADNQRIRYALDTICFRGANNQIISTDGKQALVQDGFDFPFDNDVLCPVSKIFASKELSEIGETVKVGSEGDYVYFNVGNVNFWLQKVDGKFPLMDQFTKDIDGYTWLKVDPTDAIFVSERLDILPGKDKFNSPVYIGLNDGVAVRGHDTAMQTATELRLVKSGYDGASAKMSLNRNYLKNALDFGINRIGFNPTDTTPLIGYGDKKLFVIMPLEGTEPEVDSCKLTVLLSNAKASVPSKIERPVKTAKPIPVTQACRSARSHSKVLDKSKGKAAVLDDAVKLRTNLRETLGNVNDLIRSIKSQRRQDKLLRDTVNSLRKLQSM